MKTATALRIMDAIDRGRISALADAPAVGLSPNHLSACVQAMRALGVVIVTNQGRGGKGYKARPWAIKKRGPFRRMR